MVVKGGGRLSPLPGPRWGTPPLPRGARGGRETSPRPCARSWGQDWGPYPRPFSRERGGSPRLADASREKWWRVAWWWGGRGGPRPHRRVVLGRWLRPGDIVSIRGAEGAYGGGNGGRMPMDSGFRRGLVACATPGKRGFLGSRDFPFLPLFRFCAPFLGRKWAFVGIRGRSRAGVEVGVLGEMARVGRCYRVEGQNRCSCVIVARSGGMMPVGDADNRGHWRSDADTSLRHSAACCALGLRGREGRWARPAWGDPMAGAARRRVGARLCAT
jgi:hypothetical protein